MEVTVVVGAAAAAAVAAAAATASTAAVVAVVMETMVIKRVVSGVVGAVEERNMGQFPGSSKRKHPGSRRDSKQEKW